MRGLSGFSASGAASCDSGKLQGEAAQTFPLLAQSRIHQVSLECQNSHVPMELIGLLDGKEVMVGAIDVATNRIETPEEGVDRIVNVNAPQSRLKILESIFHSMA